MSVSQVENLRRLLHGLIEEIESVRDDLTDKYNTFSSILTSLESLRPEPDSDCGEVERESESDAESSSSPSVPDSDADSQAGSTQFPGLVAATSGLALARRSSTAPQVLRREPAFILDDNGNNLLYRPTFDPESPLYGLTGALARGVPFHHVPTQGFSNAARSSTTQYGNNASILAYLAASATMDKVLASRHGTARMTSDGGHARVFGSGVASEQFQLNANAPKSETTQKPVPGNAVVAPQDTPDTSASPSASRSLPCSASEKLVIRIGRLAGSRLPLNIGSTKKVERSKDSKSRCPSPETPELASSLTHSTTLPTAPGPHGDNPESDISTPARIMRSAKRKREVQEESSTPDEESRRSTKSARCRASEGPEGGTVNEDEAS